MRSNKLVLSASIILAMALVAGCSSNKASDSANQGAAGNGAASGSSAYSVPGAEGGSGAGAMDSDEVSADHIVYFGYDQSTLGSDALAILDKNIAQLRSNNQHIRLEGNADERGTREYNLALGERRANAVAQYLEANGIASSRIETISYGKERPADPGHNEAAWAKNRRVVIVLN